MRILDVVIAVGFLFLGWNGFLLWDWKHSLKAPPQQKGESDDG